MVDRLRNLLHKHDLGLGGARNPHVLLTFRFLRSVRSQLMLIRYSFGRNLIYDRFKWFGLTVLTGASLLVLPVNAQVLNDPTRPPLAWKDAPAQASIDQGPMLQSIIGTEGHKVAIISGQKIALGGHYGNAKLVQINETSVVLKTGTSTQVLKLFPNVVKVVARQHTNISEKNEQLSESKLLEKK